jgi:hypothetical protein
VLSPHKGDQLHGGGTGLPQVRGLVSRIALLLFDVDLARFFAAVLEQCAFCTPLFLKLLLFQAQRGACLH